jgi:hypothetical protein
VNVYSDVFVACWNSPGKVGLKGLGMIGGRSMRNAGGRVGLRNGGSPFLSSV